jgi:penicillin-binding protein 1A
MLKVYADETLDYKKGQFRRPASGMDMTMDCKAYELPEDSEGTEQPDNWDPNL